MLIEAVVVKGIYPVKIVEKMLKVFLHIRLSLGTLYIGCWISPWTSTELKTSKIVISG